MISDIEILTDDEQKVSIDGRVFVLKELPASKERKYLDYISALSFNQFDKEEKNDEEKGALAYEFLEWLLGIDKEWVDEHITASKVMGIIRVQNRLNRVEERLKKVLLRPAEVVENS